MRTFLLTMLAVTLLPNFVQAGKASYCPPQPVCRTAPATVQCRTILPYHIALQRADVADQLEVVTKQQTAEIDALKAELLAVQQERDSILKQAEQEKALALEARRQSEAALAKLQTELEKSQDARKVVEAERENARNELAKVKKNLDQTQQTLAKAETSLSNERENLLKMSQQYDDARTKVEALQVALADMQAKLKQSEQEAPQKAPKPGETQPAKTEEPVKIEDDSNTNDEDKTNE